MELLNNKHDYIGMGLNFLHESKVTVLVIQSLKKFISDFPEQVISEPSIAEAKHLSQISKDDNFMIKEILII